MRRVALAVPVGVEPVAHVLLIEAGLVAARLVGVARPEAAGVGREHLVGQDDFAVDDAELELRVGDDDAVLGGMVAGDGVHLDGQVAQLRCGVLAEDLRAALEADVLIVVADLGLRGGREDRLGELGGVHQALGQLDAAHGALLLVLLQAAAGKVAAHDALDGEHLGLLHQHEAAAQVVGVGLELLGQVGHVGADQVVADDVLELLEPEQRDLREHCALVRDLVLQDVIERRDAVGGHHQQLVAQVVDVAHLALCVRLDIDSAHACLSFPHESCAGRERRPAGICAPFAA